MWDAGVCQTPTCCMKKARAPPLLLGLVGEETDLGLEKTKVPIRSPPLLALGLGQTPFNATYHLTLGRCRRDQMIHPAPPLVPCTREKWKNVHPSPVLGIGKTYFF